MTNEAILLVSDFDGTITRYPMEGNSHWSVMDRFVLDADHLTASRILREFFMEKKRLNEWNEQLELFWFELSIKAWVRCGLTRDHIANCFRDNSTRLRAGLRPFLEWLKQPRPGRPIYVAINSYGIREMIETILETEGVRHLVDEIIAMDLAYDEHGRVTGINKESTITLRIKGERTLALMQRLGIPAERTIGIGDTPGDAKIVPPKATSLLLASSHDHVTDMGRHFNEHVVSPEDWSGPRDWLTYRFGL